jgi:hypothetical protein
MRGMRIVVGVILVVGVVGIASPAFARGSSPGSPPKGDITFRDTGSDDAAEVRGAPDVASGVLPFTGAQLTGFVVVALLTIGTGVLLVRRTKSHARRLT